MDEWSKLYKNPIWVPLRFDMATNIIEETLKVHFPFIIDDHVA
jgi:hypothetical protein